MKIEGSITRVKEGVEAVMSLVASTYGHRGCNVAVVGNPNNPYQVFDDGKKAIESFRPLDELQAYGVSIIRDAAETTWRKSGDGTTSTALFAGNLLLNAWEMIKDGKDRHEVANEVSEACDTAVKMLKEVSANFTSRSDMEKWCVSAATMAAHGDKELGELVGKLVFEIGADGIISAEPSTDGKWATKKSAGIQWGSGVLSEAFFNVSGSMVHDRPLLLFFGNHISAIKDAFWQNVFSAWEICCEDSGFEHPLIVVCPSADGSFLKAFSTIARQKPFGVVALKDAKMIEDIAVATGGEFFSDVTGSARQKDVMPSNFGRALKIRATLRSCSIAPLPEQAPKINARIEYIQSVLATIDSPTADVTSEYKSRIATLASSSGTIYYPLVSATQFSAEREIIEDVHRAAMNVFDGVIPGLAYTFHWIGSDPSISGAFVRSAFRSLFFQLCDNEGLRADATLSDDLLNRAFDMKTMQFGDPVELGIVDTLSTAISVIEHAKSAVIPVIKTKYIIHYDFQ